MHTRLLVIFMIALIVGLASPVPKDSPVADTIEDKSFPIVYPIIKIEYVAPGKDGVFHVYKAMVRTSDLPDNYLVVLFGEERADVIRKFEDVTGRTKY